jgi:hypothetical protein
MLTIKKINDRKTTNTDVVIRMSFREALRLDTFLQRQATAETLKLMSSDTETFIYNLRTDLDKLLND